LLRLSLFWFGRLPVKPGALLLNFLEGSSFQFEVLLFIGFELRIYVVDNCEELGHALDVHVGERLSLDDPGDAATHHQAGLVDISGHLAAHLVEGVPGGCVLDVLQNLETAFDDLILTKLVNRK
jgi:hypothetical protein